MTVGLSNPRINVPKPPQSSLLDDQLHFSNFVRRLVSSFRPLSYTGLILIDPRVKTNEMCYYVPCNPRHSLTGQVGVLCYNSYGLNSDCCITGWRWFTWIRRRGRKTRTAWTIWSTCEWHYYSRP